MTMIFNVISMIFILISSLILSVECQTKTCNTERSCADKSFGSNYTHLSCQGFQSCKNISSTTVSARVDCTGSQSCSYISHDKYLTVGTANCQGYESCSHSTFETNVGTIYCYGEKSCLFSDITMYYDNTDNSNVLQTSIECRGVLSCALSNITSNIFTDDITSYITATGMFSLFNTTIDSTNSNLNIELSGYYTGLNSTILCGYDDGYECIINCKGTGCYRTKILCFDNDLCSISCNETNGDICPLNITYFGVNDSISDIDIHDPSSYFVEYTNNHGVNVDINRYVKIDNKDNICLNATGIEAAKKGYFKVCNDYRSCDNETFIDNNNQSVCCQGDTSCSISTITTPTKTYLNSQNQYKEIIRCDGEDSCQLTTFIANNSVDCSGYHSCQSAQLDTADVTHCSGYYSCLSASIADSRAVFCNGEKSCYQASVSGVSNVFGFGNRAFNGATIRSSQAGDTMNIFMCSYLSGYDAELCCYSQDTCNVFCANNGACSGIKISDGEGCGNINNITFNYNSTIAKDVCQVYLPTVTDTLLNSTNSSNLTMVSTTSGVSQTKFNMTNLMTSQLLSTLYWNDSFFNDSSDNNNNNNGGSSDSNESTKNPSNSNASEAGLTTAVIIIASLVVAAVVGLGVFYCIKSKNANKGKSGDEAYNQLLDMDKSEL